MMIRAIALQLSQLHSFALRVSPQRASMLCAMFLCAALCLGPGAASAQRGGAFAPQALPAPPRDGWRTNGGTFYNQRYSPLTAINTGNVAQLKGVEELFG
jgi:glucose dehydrogenase